MVWKNVLGLLDLRDLMLDWLYTQTYETSWQDFQITQNEQKITQSEQMATTGFFVSAAAVPVWSELIPG